MTTFRKRLFSIICMIVCNVCFAIAQTDTIKHTVDRGETLASIAKRYATTEAQIIELNPDAKQFVYVGMVLTIPVKKTTKPVNVEKNTTQKDFNKSDMPEQFKEYVESTSSNSEKWIPVYDFAYGFIPKPKGEDKSGNSYLFSEKLGVNYNVTESFYLGARLGYSFLSSRTKIKEIDFKSDLTEHILSIPMELGYRIFLNDNDVALVPYAGIDINCAVKCTIEAGFGGHTEKETIHPDNRVGINGRIGMRLKFKRFTVGGSYLFSFDDNYGDNKGFPEISIGAGI